MKLYSYYQSSASYRVRIALNLKGIAYESVAVNLVKAEQRDTAYASVNPQMQVPSLVLDSGQALTQSLSIMEYLEETHPTPPLLPTDPIMRAQVRAFSLAIATDISPMGNLKIRKYLTTPLGIPENMVRTEWLQHWTADGLAALEALLRASPHVGSYCFGESPGMADCCLIPQLFAARRWGTDLAPYPTILKIADACDAHPAFRAAHPSQQTDAV
ncbi:MAG: maleylacetoacetate isomerase [Rickettsiales bacterium]|nr:maleylacetoacetate isomerase [Rickettsiales bacterium]